MDGSYAEYTDLILYKFIIGPYEHLVLKNGTSDKRGFL